MTKVCDIRNAICHRTSEKSLLNPTIRLIGAFNFKDNDIEIQYGQIKLWFIKDVIHLYRGLKKYFCSSTAFSNWSKHPMCDIDDQKLEKVVKKLEAFDFSKQFDNI